MKFYTKDEVMAHNSIDSCWVIIDGNVLDLTEFLKEHPGGRKVILSRAGRDATKIFHQLGHSQYARNIMDRYVIGICKNTEKPESLVKARRYLEKRITAVREKTIISPELYMYIISVVVLFVNVYTVYQNPIVVSISAFCGAYFIAQLAFITNHLAAHQSFVENNYKGDNLHSVAFFHHYAHPHVMPKYSILHSISGFIPVVSLFIFFFFFFFGALFFYQDVSLLERLSWLGFFGFWILLEEPGHDYYHVPSAQRKNFFKGRYIHLEYIMLKINEKIGLLSDTLHFSHHRQDVNERHNVLDFDDYGVPLFNKLAEFVWRGYLQMRKKDIRLAQGIRVRGTYYSFFRILYFSSVLVFTEIILQFNYIWIPIAFFVVNLGFTWNRIYRKRKKGDFVRKPAVKFASSAQLINQVGVAKGVKKLTFSTKKRIKKIGLCEHIFVFIDNPNSGYYHNNLENHEFLWGIERSYTPVSVTKNTITLVVKEYKKGKQSGFPDGGKASQYLCNLKENDTIKIIAYDDCPFKLTRGRVVKKDTSVQFDNLLLIAGGAGITPFIRIINNLLLNSSSGEAEINIFLFYFCTEEADIVMKDELNRLQTGYSRRFKIFYYKTSEGEYLTKDILQKNYDFGKSNSALSLVCGPRPLLYRASEVLSELNFPTSRLIKL